MSRQDLVVLVMLVAIPALPATPCVEVCKDQETFSHLVESCRCGGRIVNTAGQSRNPVQPGYHRPHRPQQPVRVSYPASSYSNSPSYHPPTQQYRPQTPSYSYSSSHSPTSQSSQSSQSSQTQYSLSVNVFSKCSNYGWFFWLLCLLGF